MSETKPPLQPAEAPDPDRLTMGVKEREDVNLRSAKVLSGPFATNAIALLGFTRSTEGVFDLDKLVKAMTPKAERVENGDMGEVEASIASQAMVFNRQFADLVRRLAANYCGQNFEAGECSFKMAYRAQNQLRMPLETLSTIKNPDTIIAKQVSIAHSPHQATTIDQLLQQLVSMQHYQGTNVVRLIVKSHQIQNRLTATLALVK